ncbi:MAG: TIR domain-containing protein [Candidatus Pseudobacter hemicellulosilyticus]|uniref:TIR domain-containing protein n=1 Tax=Candidatus Pseudobacter hemicellulosilyticus TaxID=3121375 RepID=A0AAJ5WP84_9BACT|nr:MAG: TIR domain-containing protein [Pseudobacter sp.]
MANCILCSRKLSFFNTPLFGSSKLRDGGIVCSRCCNWKINTDTFWKLRTYTLSDLNNALEVNATAAEQKKADKLLQKKQQAEKRIADKLLQEKARADKQEADRLLLEKANAEKKALAEKLLQEKAAADKRAAAEKLLREEATAEAQMVLSTVVNHLTTGLLQTSAAVAQKSADSNGKAPAPKNYTVMQIKDVFVCHASEDKSAFIEPLIEELSSVNISCWYDNSEIKWGDSIVKKVNQGLSNSRFVLVAISINSIRKHWPNAELEASINMEFSTGETKVLPLLIGNEEEIKLIIEHYPILRSKLYVNYSIGLKEISRLLKERIVIND